MSKYIIEIEEKPLCVFDKDTQTYFPRLWRVKGFNSLVFDEEGLSRLEELNSDYINEHYGDLQDEAYQRGLEDAWGCAKKLFSEMSDTEIEKVFPVEWKNGFKGLMQMKPQYAIDKIKDHEAKQKQEDELKYHVGDEFDNGSGRRFVVMKVDDNGEVDRYFDGNGTTYRMDLKYPNMKKTGRRFDISSILKELR